MCYGDTFGFNLTHHGIIKFIGFNRLDGGFCIVENKK